MTDKAAAGESSSLTTGLVYGSVGDGEYGEYSSPFTATGGSSTSALPPRPLYGSLNDKELHSDEDDDDQDEYPPECVGKIPYFYNKWKYAMLVCTLYFLYGAATTIPQPMLPGIKRRYFGGDQAAARVSTIFDAVSAFLALLLAPLWGTLMDSVGRKPFFVATGIVNFIPSFLLLVSPVNPLPYMIANALSNLLTNAFYVTYLADHYPPKIRASVYAFALAAQRVTDMTAFMSMWLSNEAIMIVSAVLTAIAGAMACFLPGESLPIEHHKKFSCANLENPFRAMKCVLSSKLLIAAVFVVGVFNVANTGIREVYLYFLNQRIHFDKKDNGLMLAEMGIIVFLGLTVAVPLLTRVFKIRHVSLILVSCIGLLIENIGLSLFSEAWQVYAIGMPTVMLVTLSLPCLNALIANAGKEEEQGRRQVGYAALNDVFVTIASLIFGQTYSDLKGSWVIFPFVLSAVMAIPAFFVAILIRRWVIQAEKTEAESSRVHFDDDGDITKTEPGVV